MSLAHEGNPKEDSIRIGGGDVLSTAQLSIAYDVFGGSQATPPATLTTFNVSSSCPDTFTWPTGRSYIPFYHNTSQSGGSLTIFTDQGGVSGGTAPVDTWLHVAIETKPHCCGCAYVPVEMIEIPTIANVNFGSPSVPDIRPQGIYPVHDITMGATLLSVQDTPYAGIACFIQDGSTAEDFTGYVLACNWERQITNFMKYVHQSLCGEGTILGTIAAVPSTLDDFIGIQVYTDPNASSISDHIWELVAVVQNSAGTNYATPIDTFVHDSLMDVTYNNICLDPNNITSRVGDRHNRANVGFVAIGNQPIGNDVGGISNVFLGGTVVFGADSTHYGWRSRCDSFTFARGEVA